MTITMDGAGRIVIPKELRERLGLRAGSPIEVRVRDGRLELEPGATPMRLMRRGRGLVAVPARKLPVLTTETVRETLEGIRR
jgi:AbrB family looped-hinge helix DNA binding protein